MNLFIQSNHPQNGQLTFFTWLCTCYIITHFSIFDNFIAHKYKYLLQKVKKKKPFCLQCMIVFDFVMQSAGVNFCF